MISSKNLELNLEKIVAELRNSQSSNYPCSVHEDSESLFVCASCGGGICKKCLTEIKFADPLICKECAKIADQKKVTEQKKASGIVRKLLSYSNAPLIWVLFCIVLAGLLFAFGIGKPDLEKYREADMKLPWFFQRNGLILLSKATREKHRSAYLSKKGDSEKARQWAKASASSFLKTADFWKDSKIYGDLMIAYCAILAESGEKKIALKQLEALKSDDSRLIPYISLNKIRIRDENNPEEFERIAREIMREKQNLFDDLITRLADDSREGEFIEKVRIVCGTSPSSFEIAKFAEKYSLPKDDLFQVDDKGEINGKDANDDDFEIELK